MPHMTPRKPDSAMPTGEPASAVRSPRHDPCGKPSLCRHRAQGPLACGHEQTSSVNERKCRGWGGGVVGDRRVGSVDARSRETRLEHSEPTTVWYGLWDKVLAERNLQAAFWAVWRNAGAPGADGQTVQQFDAHAATELARLRDELRNQHYRRQPARRVWIPKPGTTEKRPLGIPAVRDRTVEAATRNVLEPIFERDFAEHSYGFRPGRGCREAVGRVEELLSQGHVWCVDADLKSYFDTIPHEGLMALVKQRIVDGSVLALLEQCLKAGVLEELKGWQPTERGTPQGAVISPLLANLYLNPLDHEVAGQGWAMVRYADDFVVLCHTKEEAERVLAFLRDWTARAGLSLHPTKTRTVNADSEGFDFLGWHFRGGKKWPRKKSLQKLQEKMRPLTRRTHGRSL